MRRVRQGDRVATTQPSFISEIRNYPVGTTGVVDTYLHDLDADGYVTTGWAFVHLSDDTLLAYPVDHLWIIHESADEADTKRKESAE
ncbi:MAG: hypothetical protein KBD06_03735 [Candidatus Pacebacteria bacterium]|nr:hypothetical protein [Candidatus Paceibacterota bacterium]